MNLSDEVRGQTRWAVALKTLEQALETAKSLGPNLDVKSYRFDATLREPKLDETSRARRPRDRPRHRHARGREPRGPEQQADRPDGRSSPTSPPTTASTPGRRPPPPRPAGPGRHGRPRLRERRRRRDRRTSPSATSSPRPTVFVKNQLEVRGTLVARGFAGQPIDVELLVEGQAAAGRPRCKVPEGTDVAPITGLKYIPQTPGEKKITSGSPRATASSRHQQRDQHVRHGPERRPERPVPAGPELHLGLPLPDASIGHVADIQVEGVVIRRPARGETERGRRRRVRPRPVQRLRPERPARRYLTPRQHNSWPTPSARGRA